MAQKKLNKNLVAFLTTMGILLSVTVVAVATYRGAKKDPEQLATNGRKLQESGEFERAIDMFLRAYDAARHTEPVNVKYLIEASQCAWKIGEISKALEFLKTANAQRPDDADVLKALLERFWEMRDFNAGDWISQQTRDYADAMLKLQPDNVLALLCRAEALRALSATDPHYKQESETRLQRAIELDPTDTRVVLVRATRELEKLNEAPAPRTPGAPTVSPEERATAIRTKALEYLNEGLKSHPGDMQLNVNIAQVLYDMQKPEECQNLLDRAIAANPTSPELQMVAGKLRYAQLTRQGEKLTDDERKKLIADATTHLTKAVELEKAFFDGYSTIAQLKVLDIDKSADPATDLARRYNAALAVYEDAIQRTVGLRSLRAALGGGGRLQLLYDGFRTARGLQTESKDPAEQKSALARATRFVEDAKVQFPENAITYYMQGDLAAAEKDTRRAIQAYTKAEDKSRDGSRMLNRMANEQLAILYRESGEYGSAMKYGQNALDSYTAERREVPLWLQLHRAQMLNQLDRAQEAYELLADLKDKYPSDQTLVRILAESLTRLKRGDEAAKLLADKGGGDASANLMMQARLAMIDNDLPTAETSLKKILEQQPDRVDLARMLVSVMTKAERRDEARQFIGTLVGKVQDPDKKLVLDTLNVLLSINDPAERDAKLLAIIEKIPDEQSRTRELYNFYANKGDTAKANSLLEQLEKSAPNDVGVIEEQFIAALRAKQFDKAEKYVTKLAAANADACNGARYRGQLALSRGNFEQAAREFRTATTMLPNDSNLKLSLALALACGQSSKAEEALEVLNEAVAINPRNLDARKMLFQAYEQLGRKDEGLPHLEMAQKIAPDDPFVKSKAEYLEEEKDPQIGIKRRAEAAKKNPKDAANLIRLGQLYGRARDGVRADECFRAAMELEPANEELARIAGTFYADTGNREAGEKMFRDHIAACPGLVKLRAQLRLGRFYEMLRLPQEARSAYEQADKMIEELTPDATARRTMHIETGFQMSEFLIRAGYPLEAIEACRRLLDTLKLKEEEPLVQRARLRIIDTLLRMARFNDAEQEINNYVRDFPKEIRGLSSKARLLLARSQLEEARTVLSLLLQSNPDDPWSLYNRGSVNVQLRRFPEAREDLLRAKQFTGEAGKPLDEVGSATRLRLATLYQLTNQLELAEQTLRELLDLTPTDTMVASRLIQVYRNSNNLAKAQEVISEYMNKFPKSPFWPFQLGKIMTEREDYVSAAGAYKIAVDLTGGTNPEALAVWLQSLNRANRSSEAVKAFEALQPEQMTPIVWLAGGQSYLATKQPDKAAALFEKSLREASAKGLADANIAAVQLSRFWPTAEVVKLLRKLTEAEPVTTTTGQRLRTVLATALMDTQAIPEALAAADAVIAAAAEVSAERWGALLIRAQALYLKNDRPGSMATYEQVLKLDPNNSDALNNMAYFLAEDNRPQEALKYAERAAASRADDPNVLDTYGLVLLKAGKLDEAEVQLREALRFDAQNPAALLHLGEVQEKAGRRSEAMASYRQALDAAQKKKNESIQKQAEEKLGKKS